MYLYFKIQILKYTHSGQFNYNVNFTKVNTKKNQDILLINLRFYIPHDLLPHFADLAKIHYEFTTHHNKIFRPKSKQFRINKQIQTFRVCVCVCVEPFSLSLFPQSGPLVREMFAERAVDFSKYTNKSFPLSLMHLCYIFYVSDMYISTS